MVDENKDMTAVKNFNDPIFEQQTVFPSDTE